MFFATCSQGQIPFCYTGRLLPAGATYPCRAIRERVVIDSTCEDKLYQTPTFADAVRKLQTNELRNTVMLRLRRVAGLCSRMVSDTANRLLKRTDSEGSPSVAEEKSSVVPLFGAVAALWSASGYLTRER